MVVLGEDVEMMAAWLKWVDNFGVRPSAVALDCGVLRSCFHEQGTTVQ
jgi:hypothetical protein